MYILVIMVNIKDQNVVRMWPAVMSDWFQEGSGEQKLCHGLW